AAPAARPARPAAAEDRSGLLGGLWRSLGFWRLVAAAGLAAAALLAAYPELLGSRADRAPAFFAVLTNDENEPAALVALYSDQSGRVTLLRQTPVPPGQELVLWTVWDPAVGARSLARFTQGGR